MFLCKCKNLIFSFSFKKGWISLSDQQKTSGQKKQLKQENETEKKQKFEIHLILFYSFFLEDLRD